MRRFRMVGSGVQKFIFRGQMTLPMENALPAKNEFLNTRPLTRGLLRLNLNTNSAGKDVRDIVTHG